MKPADFQVGQTYASEKLGSYTVTANDGENLTVLFAGSVTPRRLDAVIQARILTRRGYRDNRFTSSNDLPFTGADELGLRDLDPTLLGDWRFWTLVGFFATKFQSITFRCPPHAEDKLLDALDGLAPACLPKYGIYPMPDDTWSFGGRIRFHADDAEVAWVRYVLAGYGKVFQPDPDQGFYEVNHTKLMFELLHSLGFPLGNGTVDAAAVRERVPERHRDAFDRGVSRRLDSER